MQTQDPEAREIALLASGDVAALERAYRALGARVQRVCLGLLGDRDEAEDATQDVFVLLRERARQFRGRARLSTWVHTIAVNHCLHILEKRRLRTHGPLDGDEARAVADPAPSPAEAAATTDAREVVLARLARLSDEHRVVLTLREIDGLAYDEIAQVLDVPVGTVMSRLSRARERWLDLSSGTSGALPLERTR